VHITHTTLLQRNEVEALKSYSEVLEKKVDSRRSLDLVLILRPSADMRKTADESRVPTFSNAMGWKIYDLGILAYLSHFLEAYDTAKGHNIMTLTSQASKLPSCQGKRVKPSGY